MMTHNEQEAAIKVKLSEEERKAILQYCRWHSDEPRNTIETSSDGRIMLSEDNADILVGELHWVIPAIGDEKVRAVLQGVADRIPVGPEMAAAIRRSTKGDYKKVYGLQDVWNQVDEDCNNLTPDQLRTLQHAKWGENNCPVKFNTTLSLNEVNSSIFFRNTRLFLQKLLEFHNEITATDKGNLNRAFVKAMFDQIELTEVDKLLSKESNKVLKETDAFPLHIIRIVCELGNYCAIV